MATRLKKIAAQIPQTKSDCAVDIKLLGDLQREFERVRGELNDRIAELTKSAQPQLEALSTRIQELQSGVQAYCESHRAQLCAHGGKTANLVTGEVAWRLRPPSVSIRGVGAVLETLTRMGLTRFVRTKQEPNKEAMLNEPEAVRGIAGITVVGGVEDFIITPFELQADVAQGVA